MQIFGLIELSYAVLGLGVGLLVGMTGVGGGSLMTPLLILLFGVHPVTAVGTDLLFAAATKSAGTLVNGFNRTVEWRLVALLAAGSLPASARPGAVPGIEGGPAGRDGSVSTRANGIFGASLLR